MSGHGISSGPNELATEGSDVTTFLRERTVLRSLGPGVTSSTNASRVVRN